MNTSLTSRRRFLKAGAASALLAGSGFGARSLFAAQDAAPDYGAKRIPIALQLYTIGRDFSADPAGTLAKLAKLGFKGVEFAGGSYGNLPAKDLRKILDDHGLQACGSHTAFASLQGEQLAATIEFNQAIGNPRLIAPSLPGLRTKKAIEDAAETFNALADKLKPLGLRTGFHCHPGEFNLVEDEKIWDIFFSKARPEVIMQCDLGHMVTGGGDPVAYMKKYPGRAASVHVKPSHAGRGQLLGSETDKVKWPEVFQACESVGGTEWYIVEYDGGTMAMVETTMGTLKKWGKI